ncbi:MAG TPA: hypothetical protein VMN60_02995 [Longimicrobiales bacterium]|nr:hypothetical protein [Longimicrobiales bacterium]
MPPFKPPPCQPERRRLDTRKRLGSAGFELEGSLETNLTADVVLAAESLFDIPECTDRLIAATARALKLPLITRDATIAQAADVEAVW